MEKGRYEFIAKQIFESSLDVHREMGPGLLESVYEECMYNELRSRKLYVERQIFLPLVYKGKELMKEFRLDLLVEHEIIIEIKAVEIALPVHSAQIISYLRLADKKMGFLINFNVALIKNGFRRFVNGY